MAGLRFERDPRKDRANQKKHGVSFAEAKTVFLDEFARIIDDPEHAEGEERFLMLGIRRLGEKGIRRIFAMKKRYDFSKSRPNPYLRKAKKSVTIRLDEDTVQYFKDLAGGTGIPYQNLINLYLRDCAAEKKRLKMEWAA